MQQKLIQHLLPRSSLRTICKSVINLYLDFGLIFFNEAFSYRQIVLLVELLLGIKQVPVLCHGMNTIDNAQIVNIRFRQKRHTFLSDDSNFESIHEKSEGKRTPLLHR